MAIGLGIGLSPSFGSGQAPVSPLPPTQTITFGAKTRTGHGAHLLGYTGSGTLSIASGNGSGHWQIGQNALSPKGAGGYGTAGPAFSGPYTLVVTDGTYSSTVTINIVADAFTIREMTSVANTGRWATDSMYTVDAANAHQIRTLAAGAILTLGDTIYCRDGTLNPTGLNMTIRPAVSYSGTGVITIRSETVDTSLDANGIPNRMHGFRIGGLSFDTTVSGDVLIPYDFEDVWIDVGGSLTTGIRYANERGWGVSIDNSRLSAASTHTAPQSCKGFELRGATAYVVHCTNTTSTNLSKAITVASSAVGGRTADAVIEDNYAYELFEDHIFDTGTATSIKRNFSRDYQYAGIGDHPDGIQHVHDTTDATTTYDGPIVENNIIVTNSDASFDPQGVFSDDSAAARTLTNVSFSKNIVICVHPNGVFMARMSGPTSQFNTALSLVTVSSIGSLPAPTTVKVVVPSGKAGTDGTFNYNAANDVDVGAQGGTVVSTPNAEFATRTLAAYQVAFPDYTETGLVSFETVMAALTPANVLVADGGCKNPDGTYNGAIGPDGDWNTGGVY